MGKNKLAIAKPTIIQTELRPLDESFWIDQNNQLEQWYYQNTGDYSPDRQITPLQLTPMLSCKDADTCIAYTPSFVSDASGVQWFVKEWNGSAYAESQITSQTATDFYYLNGNVLVVQKNNPDASHAINVRVKAKYIDPRDEGITRTVEASVILPTSVDATQVFPTLDILEPSSRPFNPLKDDPIFKFHATSNWNGVAQRSASITDYACDSLGTEEILPTNEDMVVSASPILQLDYPSIKQNNQQFTYRQTANGQGSGNGMALVKNIKGNTVVWNQFINQNSWLDAYNGSVEYLNATESKYTATGTGYNMLYLTDFQPLPSGHKMYLCVDAKLLAGNATLYISFNGPQEGISLDHNLGTQYERLSGIVTSAPDWGKSPHFELHFGDCGVGTEVLCKRVLCIDLTLMFGAGNEPETVAEFETWLANNVGLKDYYEYCSGKLVSFGGTSVKMNQLVKNGNFADGTNNWSVYEPAVTTISAANNILKQSFNVGTGYSTFQYGLLQSGIMEQQHIYLMVGMAKCSKQQSFYVELGGDYSGSFSLQANEKKSFLVLARKAQYNENLLIYPNSIPLESYTIEYSAINIIDLTEMFGEEQEPDLAWCEAHFTSDYYPYHTGYETNLLNITGQKTGLKSVGFNQWDEEWEVGVYNQTDGNPSYVQGRLRSKKPIKVVKDVLYYIKSASKQLVVLEYDEALNYLHRVNTINSGVGVEVSFASACGYIKFYTGESYPTYNNDICISISDTTKNGTYEAHKEAISDMSWVRTLGIENFNIWDEEWENGVIDQSTGVLISNGDRFRSKNFIPCTANTTYYNKSVLNLVISAWDSRKNYIGVIINTENIEFTTPSNCAFLKFYTGTNQSTYNHDICINKSIPHFNGRYYPYGVTAPYFPNGLCKAGSVFDEVKVEDGVVKAVKRVGSVDLGRLEWRTLGQEEGSFRAVITNMSQTTNTIVAICSKYSASVEPNGQNIYYATEDKVFVTNAGYGGGPGLFAFRDTAFANYTTSQVAAALRGVTLYYELATPYEFEMDIPRGLYKWFGIDGSGNETEIQNTHAYTYAPQDAGKGQDTDCISVNALYGESLPVILRVKSNNWGNPLLPLKVTKSVSWKIPPIDVVVVSDKGSAVRASHISSSANFIFSTIVNQQGVVISDEVKQAQMAFNWYYTKYGASTIAPVSLGFGLTKSVAASTLRNATAAEGGTSATTGVNCDAYVWGAYELVSGSYVRRIQLDDGTWVTKAD